MRTAYGILLLVVAVVALAGCTAPPPGTGDLPPTPAEASPASTSPVPSPPSAGPTLPADHPLMLDMVANRTFTPGEEILIHGDTILSPGNALLLDVRGASFRPTNKTAPVVPAGGSAVVEVEAGPPGGYNTWSYLLNTSGYPPDLYLVEVSAVTVKGAQASSSFIVVANTTNPA